MHLTDQDFSFGIEEEYFLVERATSALPQHVPEELFARLHDTLGTRVSPEFIRSQVEINTPVCTTAPEAMHALVRLRAAIAHAAAGYGLAPIAAGTHPFAGWRQQRHTDAPRYNAIAWDFQGPGRRMLISGLHVHIGIADPATRIHVMNEIRSFLPIVLALSTSSPFWEGEKTGLKSYRTAIADATPRKGMPEAFRDWAAYRRTVETLVRTGVIEDTSKIWWDVRPSDSYPTLEVRIADVCPRVDDTVALAMFIRCLCRAIVRTGRQTTADVGSSLLLLNENRWRAQRYGIDDGVVDTDRGAIVPFADRLDDVLTMIEEDATYLDCGDEMDHLRRIARTGTSADRQRRLYDRLTRAGATPAEALQKVVDTLVRETASKPQHAASALRGSLSDTANTPARDA